MSCQKDWGSRARARPVLLFQSCRHRAASQFEIQQPLDFADLTPLTTCAEGGSSTAKTRAARSTYAVNEILG
jgi:hypothetical protein